MIAEAQQKTVIIGITPPVNSKGSDELEKVLDELSEGFWQPEIKAMFCQKKTKNDEGDRILYQISYQNARMINNQTVK